MSRFPETDVLPFENMVSVLSEPTMFEAAHSQAESVNRLYNLGHAGIKMTLDTLVLDPRVNAAMQSGIKAYEALGSMALGDDVHRLYTSEYVFRIMAVNGMSNFTLNFLDLMGQSERAMATEVPDLRDAIAELIGANLADSSPELRQRGLEGAAVMRSLQLELDELLDFEADFVS